MTAPVFKRCLRKLKQDGWLSVSVKTYPDLQKFRADRALHQLHLSAVWCRYIAINDNFDTIDPNSTDNDFAGIKNWFNEFYARDTSRKIRAVQKSKGERGVPLTVNVPYGYLKEPENPTRWKIDPVAADVVKHIFSLCMEGRGPKQIANQLKADKVLTPTAYKTLQGIKSPNSREIPMIGTAVPLWQFSNGGIHGLQWSISRPSPTPSGTRSSGNTC